MTQQAKEEILAAVRAAVANAPEPLAIERAYRERDARERAAILDEFIDRLIDYKAIVTRTDDDHVLQAIVQSCRQHGITRLVVPADLSAAWIPEGVTVLRDQPLLSLSDLNTSFGVLTGCAIVIAQTGTIILDGGRSPSCPTGISA